MAISDEKKEELDYQAKAKIDAEVDRNLKGCGVFIVISIILFILAVGSLYYFVYSMNL